VNKRIIAALCLVLTLFLPVRVAATEENTEQGCRIQAGEAKSLPGKTVQIAVSIAGNPGLTNFGIGLEYDAQKLELKEIRTAQGETPYLGGRYVSANTAWKTEGNTTIGYVTGAHYEKITGDDTLFVACFEVKAEAPDTTFVIPRVYYLRCVDESAVFSDITATVGQGEIRIVQKGDINMDGIVEYDDVIAAYKAAGMELELTAQALEIADMDGSGVVNMADAKAIYSIYTGGN